MHNEIQLIGDGDGVAVIGEPAVVERFLLAEGLPSRDLGLQRLGPALGTAAGIAQAGSEVAANSGRWVKLTEKSAHALKQGKLMKGSEPGVSRAVLTDNGKVQGFLEIVRTPGSLLTNPALLAGAAGLMAQLAMQQSMDEIADYLATIDKKVDALLRGQQDAVLADMIGVGFVLEEAMTIREHVGRVSEVTWTKIQATSATIARTQAYALRQLDAIAEEWERETKIGDLARTSKDTEPAVREWLAVLARCFQLQDAIAVLELDRVLDASAEDLDQHRRGLRVARQNRLELISRSTERLLARIDAAAGTANLKVLLHPSTSPEVVQGSKQVSKAVLDLHELLGIERDWQPVQARRWIDAASEARDKVLGTGAKGVDTTRRLGGETLDRAGSMTRKLSHRISERALRRRGDEERGDEERGDEGRGSEGRDDEGEAR